MALFDFLSQPVGGYEQSSNLEGISEETQGAPKSGMNWGQLISAISSLGGQSPQGNNLMSNPFTQGNQQSFVNQGFNQSNVPQLQSSLSSLGSQGNSGDDLGGLMKLIALYFGGASG